MKESTPTVADVVARGLGGLTIRQRRLGPCPACRADRTGKGDRRPPIIFGGPRWKCAVCDATGDAINLIALVLTGDSRGREAYRAAFAWLKDPTHNPTVAATLEPEPTRVPVHELLSVLRACTPLAKTDHPDVLEFVARKFPGLPLERVPAGVIHPRTVYRWWPARFTRDFPLVVPAFTGTGDAAGMHARAVLPDVPRKSTWPRGVDSIGLLFADPRHARPFLRGAAPPARLLITEGLSDFLTACARWPDIGVLGLESGSASSLRLLAPRLGSTQVIDACHYDRHGETYTSKVVAALAPHPVTRFLYRLAA